MFISMTVNTDNQPISFKETFKSSDNTTLNHILYLDIMDNSRLMISGLNRVSENTDYTIILNINGESSRTVERMRVRERDYAIMAVILWDRLLQQDILMSSLWPISWYKRSPFHHTRISVPWERDRERDREREREREREKAVWVEFWTYKQLHIWVYYTPFGMCVHVQWWMISQQKSKQNSSWTPLPLQRKLSKPPPKQVNRQTPPPTHTLLEITY